MNDDRIISLTWLDRLLIKYALLSEADRLKALRDTAVRMKMDEDTVNAINGRINDHLLLIDKFRDKD